MEKLTTIVISAAMFIGMGLVAVPQAEAGSSVQNIMNKLGKFSVQKTGCTQTIYDDVKWTHKITKFSYDTKAQAISMEYSDSRIGDPKEPDKTTYKKSWIPLTDIMISKLRVDLFTTGTGSCSYVRIVSKDGLIIDAPVKEFESEMFGTPGGAVLLGYFKNADAAKVMGALKRALKMIQ